MITFFYPQVGGGNSTDPGVVNVLSGVNYTINGTPLVGTLSLGFPTASQIADAVWDEAISGHTTAGTFGTLMKKLLTVGKFLGLKG